ncbi:hypothetical protein AM228_26830 [Planktothricoides sp. SR001]|nr:hypothetical protein AM228_26830 [Planktothricoides sp. SR001]
MGENVNLNTGMRGPRYLWAKILINIVGAKHSGRCFPGENVNLITGMLRPWRYLWAKMLINIVGAKHSGRCFPGENVNLNTGMRGPRYLWAIAMISSRCQGEAFP